LAGVSSSWPGCVESGHQFAVGGAGGGEVLVAFFELQPQFDDSLFERHDVVLQLVDVGGGTAPRFSDCGFRGSLRREL